MAPTIVRSSTSSTPVRNSHSGVWTSSRNPPRRFPHANRAACRVSWLRWVVLVRAPTARRAGARCPHSLGGPTMHVSVLSALITVMPLQVQQGQRDENPPAAIRATGMGKLSPGRPSAQSRLMARRAAEVVAVRNLAAKLHGLSVDPTEGTRRITTAICVRGIRYGSSRLLPDGQVEVTVELPLTRRGTRDARTAVGQSAVQTRLSRMGGALRRLMHRSSSSRGGWRCAPPRLSGGLPPRGMLSGRILIERSLGRSDWAATESYCPATSDAPG
jgi:hypothetical protein